MNYPWHKNEDDKRVKPITCPNCGKGETFYKHTHAYVYEVCANCNTSLERY